MSGVGEHRDVGISTASGEVTTVCSAPLAAGKQPKHTELCETQKIDNARSTAGSRGARGRADGSLKTGRLER